MNTTIKTLSTVQALGADCVEAGGFAYVTGLEPMLIDGIAPSSVIAPVTEVLQVTTGTPTAANSTLYGINLVYTNKQTGILESKDYYYTSDASATPTEIGDYFRAAILADSPIVPVVGTGTTTLILTAVTGNYSSQAQFTATSIGTGAIAFVTGTAAVVGVGKGLFLTGGEYSDPVNAPLVDSSYYYQVNMVYTNGKPEGSVEFKQNQYNRNVLYVLSTATNVETLVGTYGTLTDLLAGYTTSYVAGTGTLAATAATDLLTLAGGGEFAAQGIGAGSVLFQVGETTYYLVNNVISTTTANAIVGVDNAAASYTIIYRVKS